MAHEWIPVVRGYDLKKMVIKYLEEQGIVKEGSVWEYDIEFIDRKHSNITDYVDAVIDGDVLFERK